MTKEYGPCPKCGTPLDEIPLEKCSEHSMWKADCDLSEQYMLESRPIYEKLEDCTSFVELKAVLIEYFRNVDHE